MINSPTPTWISNILDNFFPGAYFLSHSLSWTNNKENRGLFGGKVWIPEDPATSKANGRYPAEWREQLTNGVYTGLNETMRIYVEPGFKLDSCIFVNLKYSFMSLQKYFVWDSCYLVSVTSQAELLGPKQLFKFVSTVLEKAPISQTSWMASQKPSLYKVSEVGQICETHFW